MTKLIGAEHFFVTFTAWLRLQVRPAYIRRRSEASSHLDEKLGGDTAAIPVSWITVATSGISGPAERRSPS